MAKDYSGKTLGVIHASAFTSGVIQPYIDRIIPGVQVAHAADDSIQNTNLSAPVGTIPKQNYLRYANLAKSLQDYGADMILLACSTFNRAVEYAEPMIDIPMLQIDRPMMDLAVRDGAKVGLLATLASTVPSSERLLRIAAEEAGRKVDIRTVLSEEAFKVLRAGDKDKHNEMLLEEIEKLGKEVDAIVLAQLSMSALEPMIKNPPVPVYISGIAGVERARDMLDAM